MMFRETIDSISAYYIADQTNGCHVCIVCGERLSVFGDGKVDAHRGRQCAENMRNRINELERASK